MMKQLTGLMAAALIAIASPASSQGGDTRYITDQLHVPLRAGKGNEFRILHRGLPSGTQLTLLEDAPEEGWARVRTPDGQEGWMRRQYLVSEPVAKIKLRKAEADLARFEAMDLGGEVRRLEAENQKLNTALASEREKAQQLAKELKDLKTLSADAVALNERHQNLLKQHELLKQKQAMAEAEIQRLSSSEAHKWYMYGAMSVGLGAILAMIAPFIRPRRRRSEWAN
ncbi:TIGR04211 family SH3 domain-containing protein [Microbulbifer thermotolerans]|uniref:Peptide-binding protein n=1 Tax=Microbulbifer thermotolerans TaxID=252514 RepID=A0A143HL49_MICTH|nr:TIGR04211 family SH3 domain-containing protein [Microbulbifer thermotolerans]AMX02200.1 peptide-binding protein [Microbulbifer thermotolerans]MCX2778829.1 TIGR04211 family SH3 domain-containing protein [Microbulbifer thermotolerans]MCX2793715.1 TIGR04211 family SH3 domain-containing protein [Microbulbifer thermotolerans]MCX2804134.1 TIGR04211 family SH3 domain-containing protein [Microbulbifer thermotolerans]WKT61772.1 TIGR04211 family SH3 domain-containing protein [Microbulbifer thermotole